MNEDNSIIRCECGELLDPHFEVCPKCRTPLSSRVAPTAGMNSAGGRLADSSIGRPSVTEDSNDNEISLSEGEELLGRFVIKNRLGAGRFGTVYHAHDRERCEDIALKVLVAGPGRAQAATEQLRQALQLRDRINDFTHIVKVYDVHTADYGGFSLVLLPMEYAEAGSLRLWLTKYKHNKEHRISEGIELFKQACLGIKAIHDAGLVHWDIKPENLLLYKDDDKIIVKVSDLGTSRNVEHFSINVSSVTQAGFGAPYYISPEQIRAASQEDVGPHADIYSLGVILFEILDGDPPFDGSAAEVKQKHLQMDPPQLDGVDEKFASVVHGCLAKNATERLKDVTSVLDALGADVPLVAKPDENVDKLREAVAFYYGINRNVDRRKAKELFLELAEHNNPLGKMWVARCYHDGGCFFPKDAGKGEGIAWEVIEEVKQLADRGVRDAMLLLGIAYESGVGVDKDDSLARGWYERAAKAGDSAAMFCLGATYTSNSKFIEYGRGAQESRHWFRESAKAGNSYGMAGLASVYDFDVRNPDHEKALTLFHKAAEAENPNAMLSLGEIYDRGRGVTAKDYQKAAEWYRKAAEGGQKIAMWRLGLMYEKGRGITQDVKKAAEWYRRAAEAGDTDAMYNLGRMYEKGRGITQDVKKARYWFRKSGRK